MEDSWYNWLRSHPRKHQHPKIPRTPLPVPGNAACRGAGTLHTQRPAHPVPKPPRLRRYNHILQLPHHPRTQEPRETDVLLNSSYSPPPLFLGKCKVWFEKTLPSHQCSWAVSPELSFWASVSGHLEGDGSVQGEGYGLLEHSRTPLGSGVGAREPNAGRWDILNPSGPGNRGIGK